MKINIIGTGNVGTHLLKAFSLRESLSADSLEVTAVNARTFEGLDPRADLTIIAVSDSVIPEVLARLPEMKGVVAHTSGSTPLSVFEKTGIKDYGVFYPLQTFSAAKELEYEHIPFYIEGSDEKTTGILHFLASLISSHVHPANSRQRKALHIAAVLSCNFVNHLWTLSSRFLDENGLDFCELLPLIEESLDKIKHISPFEAQTGPAVRADMNIISSHLTILEEDKELQEIYHLLSDSIRHTHEAARQSGINERDKLKKI